MKVVLVNGSRRDAGCTYTALSVVAKELEAQGIDTEIVAVGSRVVKEILKRHGSFLMKKKKEPMIMIQEMKIL